MTFPPDSIGSGGPSAFPMDDKDLVGHIAFALGGRYDDPGKMPFYIQSVAEETNPEWRLTIGRFAATPSSRKDVLFLDYQRVADVCIQVLGLDRVQKIKDHATLLSWRARGLDKVDEGDFEKDRKHQQIRLGVEVTSNVVALLVPVFLAIENPTWVDVGSTPFWVVLGIAVFVCLVLYALGWHEMLFPKTGTPRDPYLLLTVGRAIFRGADPKVILNPDGSVNHPALLETLGRRRKLALG
jgi:hypothetical protein